MLASRKATAVHVASYVPVPATIESKAYFEIALAAQTKELQQFCAGVGEPVHVVGHSLGGWMARQLTERNPGLVDRCFLLFPFLSRPALRGMAVLHLARHLHKIPFILKTRRLVEKFFSELRYVSEEELCLCLGLAFHEYAVLGQNHQLPMIAADLRRKFHAIYRDGDTWFPTTTALHVTGQISCEKTTALHDFIVSRAGRDSVFASMLKVLG